MVFTILTHYTLVYAGTGGLNLLSFVSGFSDITPFILNLLQGTGSVAVPVITACTMQAIVSNIAVNMCYALFFAGGKSPLRPWILRGIGCVIAANISLLLFSIFSKLLSFCFFNSENLVNVWKEVIFAKPIVTKSELETSNIKIINKNSH